ncbi:uncharacterized protein LOC131252000 [Magnolia sinica]|uniref:uncharacterized protein LOC131252000 n=1 Tax=Magnolia sinica TaxID=86752 RepID=UPI002658AA2A|nr:uncharacterized protein LOC131252000 [Magnolia sinica]
MQAWQKNINALSAFILRRAISKNGRHPLISRETHPELKMFNELLCDARDFYAGITETDIVRDIVDQALLCKSHITDIVNRVLAYVNKDLSFMSENLLIVLKVVFIFRQPLFLLLQFCLS